MAERKKIGILFGYSEGWIGGSYYFVNLVSALNQIEDHKKPHILVLTDTPESYEKIVETGYPYLTYLSSRFEYNLAERLINKIGRVLSGKNIIEKGYDAVTLPLLFGYYEQLTSYRSKKKIYWIPDLQDRYYPQYLGSSVAAARKELHRRLAYSDEQLVFSSQDTRIDFDKFYPDSTCSKHVVPFAVTLPSLEGLSFSQVGPKYRVEKPFFMAPNQFWSHKNHMVVIRAVELLKQRGQEIKVVFTGNERTGGGTYAQELKDYVRAHGLEGNVSFLGFIDRKEQLVLMRESVAVIQPSVFEGWSTVVEDAKALNKFVVASDLRVHREQLQEGVAFFDPMDPQALANLLSQNLEEGEVVHQYRAHIGRYANSFLDVVELSGLGKP